MRHAAAAAPQDSPPPPPNPPLVEATQRQVPTGTVTFLFSDVEGSTSRWESHRDAMQAAMRRHDAIVAAVAAEQGGWTFKTVGDAFCIAFPTAPAALAAALEIQRALAQDDWSAVDGLKVRMAVHTGDADERDGDYFGPVVNRVARLLSSGHGGQVLVSGVTTDLAQGALPPQTSLKDLGSHRLRDLAYPEQVYQLIAPDLPATFPPLRTLDVLPNNLPLQLTSFLGRESEVAELRALLEKSRLVTLVGSGGVGKTRTSLQAAAEVLDRFPDGVWFIELAPLKDAAVIPSLIAAAMGISGPNASRDDESILEVLKSKRALIVFDNCEHLVREAAGAIDRILRTCPHVSILASSREGLSIAGESVFRMPSLAVPKPGSETTAEAVGRYGAVALFVERARAAEPRFSLTDENAPYVAEICRQLDGIALAIELAAPRIRVLNPKALVERLSERFRILTGGSRAALPRQQTMRALIDWSYDLLSESEKRLFRRVAVFAGGWTIEGATAVCTDEDLEEWDLLDLLQALVEKSLIVTEYTDGDQRYRMLESTRQYARERLAQSGEAQRFLRRHAEYMERFLTDLDHRLWRERQLAMRRAGEPELDNMRAALSWSLVEGNDTELSVRILGRVSLAFGASAAELRKWCLLAEPFVTESLPLADRARFHFAISQSTDILPTQDAYRHAMLAVQAFRELGDQNGLARALRIAASSSAFLGHRSESAALTREAVALATDPQEILLRAAILQTQSLSADDAAGRIAFNQEALEIFRARGDDLRMAHALGWLAEDEFECGNPERAVSRAREALGIYRTLLPRSLQAVAVVNNLAAYALCIDDLETGAGAMREALRLSLTLGSDFYLGLALLHIGGLAARRGAYDTAASMLGSSNARVVAAGRPLDYTEARSLEATMAIVTAALSADDFDRLYRAGASWTDEHTIEAAEAVLAQPEKHALSA